MDGIIVVRYFKLNGEVFGFEPEHMHLVKEGMIELTPEELDIHSNPGKYMTQEQIDKEFRDNVKPLTRRQFMKTMILGGYDLSVVEDTINGIEDPVIRQFALIDWKEATEFVRNDDTLLLMAQMLDLTPAKIDEMWLIGLAL